MPVEDPQPKQGCTGAIMNSVAGSVSSSSSAAMAGAVKHELPLWRLYTLRLCYLILAGGLGTFIWPLVIHHSSDFAIAHGVRFSLLAGLGLTAVLGLRYPVQMIPLLLFEMIWKAIYLVFFAMPLWSSHQITDGVADDIKAVVMVVIFIPLIPWGYVSRNYVMRRGEAWK
jgi:hypothetical protein